MEETGRKGGQLGIVKYGMGGRVRGWVCRLGGGHSWL